MPLSNDFTAGRLEYLQMQIKNTKTVKEQFYPRFQRAYNEMFPFTEGSAQNVLQPQQQIISEAVPSPNKEMIEMSLKQKLNELTRNESVTDFIINNLLITEEKYYYDQNFDSVTKELLKKVKMPVSKEDFVINLASIFNNDKHRGSIQGIKSYISPSAPPINNPPIVTVPVPGGPPTPPIPVPVPPVPAPPIPAPRKKITAAANLSPDEMLKLSVTNLKSIDPADIVSIEDARNELGDIAFKEKLTSAQLARYIKQRPRAQITQAEIDYAEQILIDAEKRDTATTKAAANPLKTPTKGINLSAIFLTPHKLDLKNRMTAEIAKYKAVHNNKMPDPKTVAHMADSIKQDIKEEAFRNKLADFEQNKGSQATLDEMNTLTAEHEQKFKGFGLKQTRIIKHKQTFNNDKYAINKKQLQKNILALKYVKNANNHATFKPIETSDQLKKVVEQNVMKREKVSESDFKALSITERRVLKRLYTFLKMDLGVNHSDNFQKEFEVMYGSFLAGNDSADLKKQLKEYIKIARHESIISKETATKMLQKLSN